jgi:hypothetical protein
METREPKEMQAGEGTEATLGTGSPDSAGANPEPGAQEQTCCENGLEQVREWTRKTEEYVKREPAKAVGAAVGVGIFLAIFPVFSVLGGLFRVLVSLLRPLLLVLGAVKLYEEYEKRQNTGGDGPSQPESDNGPQ